MATAANLAKGPLSSALGQWLFIGFGTIVIFTGDNGVSKAAQDIAKIALRLVTGGGASLLNGAASSQHFQHLPHLQPQQPIVIHNITPGGSSDGSSSRRGNYVGTLIQLSLGAGACWTLYILSSHLLPDQIKELLPVTRKFFDTAITSLGQGIIRVKEALSEQILLLGMKQDELSEKQDDTLAQVLGIKDDIGDVRLNIDDIAMAISRCENSLDEAAGRQNYMSRGVKLLVRCVGDLMRGSNPSMAAELDRFHRSAEFGGNDEEYGYAPMTPDNKARNTRPDYPASPILSEISGSGTAMAAMEEMRPLPPPQPQAGSRWVSPGSGSGGPFGRSASLPLSHQNSGLLSMQTSMRGVSGVARQGSSPEDEVPEKTSMPTVTNVSPTVIPSSTASSASPRDDYMLHMVYDILKQTNGNRTSSISARA